VIELQGGVVCAVSYNASHLGCFIDISYTVMPVSLYGSLWDNFNIPTDSLILDEDIDAQQKWPGSAYSNRITLSMRCLWATIACGYSN
jgi:hypothetical protein